MVATKPISQIMLQRFSVRIYQEVPIPDEIQQLFKSHLAALLKGPLGSQLRLELVAGAPGDTRALRGLGTYGSIKNPAGFIVGAINPGQHALEDYGFAMEKAVLHATALELGTCWLGGAFTRGGFARKIRKLDNEIIPAVTSIGYAVEDSRERDHSRQWVRADQRQPWDALFFDGRFGIPLKQELTGNYQQPLEMVRIAPSAKNKQPVRIIRDGHHWHFYCQRTPGYGKGTLLFTLLRAADLQRIDIGIAMCHFELTAHEQGQSGSWIVNDPGLPVPDQHTLYVATWKEA